MKKKLCGWFIETLRLRYTQNTMVCVSKYGAKWYYFSANEYGSVCKAKEAAYDFILKC